METTAPTLSHAAQLQLVDDSGATSDRTGVEAKQAQFLPQLGISHRGGIIVAHFHVGAVHSCLLACGLQRVASWQLFRSGVERLWILPELMPAEVFQKFRNIPSTRNTFKTPSDWFIANLTIVHGQ